MSSFRIDESTTVEAKIADLESKAERYTSSWQTEVVQFMFTAECGINELGEKYDSLQEEYEILRQEMSEISQLKSNHDTNYIERLKSLEEDMERKLAGIKEEYSQKLVSYTVTPAVLQGEASEINETHRPQLPSSTSEYSNAEKKILTKHILTLSYDLIIDEVLVYLQAKFILSRVDVQNIKAELTPFARNHALIQCLMCRDGQAFLLFVRSLRKSKQHRLANILSPSKPTASSSKKIKQQSGKEQHLQGGPKILSPMLL
uniref:CARD domain-containing protein n=1 Tax=Plectus sambesii TaxID=2011161 RepID=A0A914VSN3_9BILA